MAEVRILQEQISARPSLGIKKATIFRCFILHNIDVVLNRNILVTCGVLLDIRRRMLDIFLTITPVLTLAPVFITHAYHLLSDLTI
jgi:hypothetical protein